MPPRGPDGSYRRRHAGVGHQATAGQLVGEPVQRIAAPDVAGGWHRDVARRGAPGGRAGKRATRPAPHSWNTRSAWERLGKRVLPEVEAGETFGKPAANEFLR